MGSQIGTYGCRAAVIVVGTVVIPTIACVISVISIVGVRGGALQLYFDYIWIIFELSIEIVIMS